MAQYIFLIDGSNFYHFAKRTTKKSIIKLNYFELFSSLINNSDVEINYYVGAIKNDKSEKSKALYKVQQKLFNNLEKQNIKIKRGNFLRSNNIYHEKGVDVQIAIDMVYGALKNKYDKCYLVSSDTDLLPAVKMARQEHKEVIYVGFENKLSRALKYNCSKTLVIKKADLESVLR